MAEDAAGGEVSRGFVAVDRAALALCMTEQEAVCLFLMARMQDAAWSPSNPTPSIEVGRTYWSERTGMTEGNVRRLIDRLVDAGRAVLVHPGDRRTTKRIRLVVDIQAAPAESLPPTFPPTFPPTTDTVQPAQSADSANPAANPSTNLAATDLNNSSTRTLQPVADHDRAQAGREPKPSAKASVAGGDDLTLYAVYRAHRPRSQPTPTPDNRKSLKRILAECGSVDSAGVYLAWVFQSQDHDARRLRGEVPWPDGKPVARLTLEELSRHIEPRLARALAWDARGRTVLHVAAPPEARGAKGMLAIHAFDDEPEESNPNPRVVLDAQWRQG